MTKAEQETIIRFDRDNPTLDIYTADERVALRLQRRGYALVPLKNPTHGWRVSGVPQSALTFRRIGPDCSGKPKGRVSTGAVERLRKARDLRAAARAGEVLEPAG